MDFAQASMLRRIVAEDDKGVCQLFADLNLGLFSVTGVHIQDDYFAGDLSARHIRNEGSRELTLRHQEETRVDCGQSGRIDASCGALVHKSYLEGDLDCVDVVRSGTLLRGSLNCVLVHDSVLCLVT